MHCGGAEGKRNGGRLYRSWSLRKERGMAPYDMIPRFMYTSNCGRLAIAWTKVPNLLVLQDNLPSRPQ